MMGKKMGEKDHIQLKFYTRKRGKEKVSKIPPKRFRFFTYRTRSSFNSSNRWMAKTDQTGNHKNSKQETRFEAKQHHALFSDNQIP